MAAVPDTNDVNMNDNETFPGENLKPDRRFLGPGPVDFSVTDQVVPQKPWWLDSAVKGGKRRRTKRRRTKCRRTKRKGTKCRRTKRKGTKRRRTKRKGTRNSRTRR